MANFRLKRRYKTKLICLGLTLSLLGCSQSQPPPVPDNSTVATGVAVGAVSGAVIGSMASGVSMPLAAAMGGIAGGAIGKALAAEEGLLADLDRDHVQIVRIGEDVMIVLPSDYYFYPDSSHLNEAFFPGLDNVAEYIRQYETTNIKVAGYTDVIGDDVRNLALSRQQAQNIAHYLQRQGLNARMLYSIGYGSAFPIANNDNHTGRAANRRVQITFRYVPPDMA